MNNLFVVLKQSRVWPPVQGHTVRIRSYVVSRLVDIGTACAVLSVSRVGVRCFVSVCHVLCFAKAEAMKTNLQSLPQYIKISPP